MAQHRLGLGEAGLGTGGKVAGGGGRAGIGQQPWRRTDGQFLRHAVGKQQVARQVDAVARRILIKVAQHIHHLQCAPEDKTEASASGAPKMRTLIAPTLPATCRQ